MIDPQTAKELQGLSEHFKRLDQEMLGMLFQAADTIVRLGIKKFGPAPESTASKITAMSDLKRFNRIIERIFEAHSWDDLLATP